VGVPAVMQCVKNPTALDSFPLLLSGLRTQLVVLKAKRRRRRRSRRKRRRIRRRKRRRRRTMRM